MYDYMMKVNIIHLDHPERMPDSDKWEQPMMDAIENLIQEAALVALTQNREIVSHSISAVSNRLVVSFLMRRWSQQEEGMI